MSSDGRRPDATASYDDDRSRRAEAAAERTITNVDAIGATSPLRLDESGPEQTIGVDGLPRGQSETPERIGRFVVLHVLGAGGMGVVYAAYDPELDRKVAIKVLIGSAPVSTTVHQRLVREAQAMARLAHPNVVTVHDVGEHDGRVFVAMEYVHGLTLASGWRRPSARRERSSTSSSKLDVVLPLPTRRASCTGTSNQTTSSSETIVVYG